MQVQIHNCIGSFIDKVDMGVHREIDKERQRQIKKEAERVREQLRCREIDGEEGLVSLALFFCFSPVKVYISVLCFTYLVIHALPVVLFCAIHVSLILFLIISRPCLLILCFVDCDSSIHSHHPAYHCFKTMADRGQQIYKRRGPHCEGDQSLKRMIH